MLLASPLGRGGIASDIIYLIFIGFLLIQCIAGIIVPILQRAPFHYATEENFLTVKQGILSKQQRHIPYGVIQNLFVEQDLFDRFFGLASLTIENASQSNVNIPGLTEEDAETLKEIILQKMKDNPIKDNQSGL